MHLGIGGFHTEMIFEQFTKFVNGSTTNYDHYWLINVLSTKQTILQQYLSIFSSFPYH